jgi:hypothetical protein
MFTQRNISYVLIGKDTTVTTQTRVESLESGKIALTNKFGSVLDAGAGATDVDNFRDLRINQGGSNRATDFINRDRVISVTARAFARPTEQISYVGYNGSTGDIPATNDNVYTVRANFVGGDRSQEFPMQRILHGFYKSDLSATKLEVGAGLMLNMASEARKRYERDIKTEMTSNGTVTAITSGILAKFTKDSKTVSFYTAAFAADNVTIATGDVLNVPSQEGITYTFTASALGAGAGNHVISIGGTTYTVADAGTPTQNGVAIVAAINADTTAQVVASDNGSGVVTLAQKYCKAPMFPPVVYDDNAPGYVAVTIATGDAVPVKYLVEQGVTAGASVQLETAFQGESGYVVVGTTAATMTGIDTTPTAYGLKLTGLKRRFNVDKKLEYSKAAWVTTIKNFGSATVTASRDMFLGSGTYEQVASEDQFGDVIFGNKYRKDHLYSPNRYAEECGEYGCVTIVWEDSVDMVVGAKPVHRKSARVWFNDTTATNASTFLTVLGDWQNTTYTFV